MVDITYYPFALYVFLLVCAAIWVCGKVMRREKKGDKSSFDKEQRLFKMYQNIEDMLNAFEEYTEESKKEMAKYIEEMKAMAEGKPPETPVKPEPQVKREVQSKKEASRKEIITGKTVTEEKSGAFKQKEKSSVVEEEMKAADRIPYLVNEGMSRSEIAKELGLSVREVSLIMDIKKIKTNED